MGTNERPPDIHVSHKARSFDSGLRLAVLYPLNLSLFLIGPALHS